MRTAAWVILLFSLMVSGLNAKRPGKQKSPSEAETSFNAIPDPADPVVAERVVQKTNPKTGEMELKEEKMLLNVGASGDDDQADEIDDSATSSDGFSKTNPCANSPCEEGLECDLNDAGQPICVCMKQCPNDSPIKVCSSFNKTYDSECHLYRQRCLCQRGLPGCTDPKNKDMQLEYLRECREQYAVDMYGAWVRGM